MIKVKFSLEKIVLVGIFTVFYLLLPWLPSPIPSLQLFPTDTSLIQLIANPILFHNRKVKTIGFVSLDFEDKNLYFSEDSYSYGLYDRISLDLKNLHIKDGFQAKILDFR